MSKVFVLLVICLIFSVSSQGQSHYLLSKLEATRHDNRIILNWTIKRGGSCFGIGILRSTNTQDFEIIGEISGVCGSSEKEQNFTYIDDNPVKNKVHYYILEMGFSGRTDPPLGVAYFEFDKNKSLITPNPMFLTGKIKFINVGHDVHTLLIYDAQGRLVHNQSTENDEFGMDDYLIDLSQNVDVRQFFFTILNQAGKIISSGNFIAAKF